MNLSFRFRERLTGFVREQFDHLITGIQAGWDVEHDRDGTHTDITADSVTATDITITNGATGTFTTADGKTVTVTNGIVTGIV